MTSINRQGLSHARPFILPPRVNEDYPATVGTTILQHDPEGACPPLDAGAQRYFEKIVLKQKADDYRMNRLKSVFLARSPTCFCT